MHFLGVEFKATKNKNHTAQMWNIVILCTYGTDLTTHAVLCKNKTFSQKVSIMIYDNNLIMDILSFPMAFIICC